MFDRSPQFLFLADVLNGPIHGQNQLPILTMRAQQQALALKEAQAALVQATVEAQQQVLSQKDEERGQLQATVEALKQEIVSVKDTLGWMMGDRYRRAKDKSRLLSIVNSAVLLPIKRRIKRQPSVASKTD